MIRLVILSTTVAGILGWSPQAAAFRPGDQLRLSLDILVQEADGSRQVLCSQENDIAVAATVAWSFSMKAEGSQTACDTSIAATPPDADGALPTAPAFVAEGSLRAITVQQMQNERVLEIDSQVRISVSSGNAEPDGEPPQAIESHRKLVFGEGGRAYIPLHLPEIPNWPEVSGTDVLLRVSASNPVPAERSVHGRIHLTDLPKDVQVVLDGGTLTGRPPRGDWIVELVEPGIHSLEMRLPDGSSSHELIRVEPAGTSVASFDDPSGNPGIGLLAEGENSDGFKELRRSRDGATVIYVPGGEFLMGNQATEGSPQEHRVSLDDFLIDKTGVSWRQYKQFAAQTGTPLPNHAPYWGIHDNEPAVFVTWEEARAYCQWAGARLPTEAEREKAARGTDGRMYPWGDAEPSPELAAFRLSWGYGKPVEVDSYPEGASPYGALNMGGNVWEWVEDWYQPDYYAQSPSQDPRGPDAGTSHVVRGGSWDSRPSVLSASARNFGHRGYREGDFGFRCAMNAPNGNPLLSRAED